MIPGDFKLSGVFQGKSNLQPGQAAQGLVGRRSKKGHLA